MENLKLKYEVEYLENKVKRLEHDVEFWKQIAEKYMNYFENDNDMGFDDNKEIFKKRG